jgi:1-acyl-sn-glycerol-3-phosphate acyltransferase
LNVPVVPVAIQGSFNLMPADAWTAKGGVIEIDIMPAIDISEHSDLNDIAYQVRNQMIEAGLQDAGT